MLNIILFGILTLPWACVPLNNLVDQFRMPKAFLLDFICLSIIIMAFKRGLRFNYINKYLSWFIGYTFVVIILNWYLPLMLSQSDGLRYNLGTIETSLHFILISVASYFALSSLEKDDFIKIAKCLCLSGVLVSCFAMLQLTPLDPLQKISHYKEGYYRYSALLDNPNIVGNYLALILPIFLFFKERKYILGFIVVLSGLILSHSSLSIFCGIVGILIFTILNFRGNKKLMLSLGSVIVSILIVLALNPEFNKLYSRFSYRLDTWQETITHIKDNPLFGQGLGIFKTWRIHPKISHIDNVAHCDYMERVCEIGLVGLFLGILVIINSFRNFNYKNNKLGYVFLSSFSVFLLISCASFPMEIAPLGFIGLIGFWAMEKM